MTKISEKHSEIRKLIKERSPFDERETNRILNSSFNHTQMLVKIVIRNHQFDKKKVLDIGCAWGDSLLYWRQDSEGIEIQEHMIKFLKSLGKTVYGLDVDNGFPGLKQENYDAIFAGAVIEHLLSPHLFLVRLHSLLRPGGILAISYPVVPPPFFQGLWKMIVGYQGWLAASHINFFTPRTSKLILERAGFRVIRQYSPAFYRIPILRKINKVFLPIGMSCLSVCQRIDGFKYEGEQPLSNPPWASDLKRFR